MNDGTRADVLFKVAEALYLQLQLKTTATTIKNQNGYRFKHVPATPACRVCWVVDLKKAVFDGTCPTSAQKTSITLLETHALANALTMEELIAYLHDHTHAEHLRLTTEDAARRLQRQKSKRRNSASMHEVQARDARLAARPEWRVRHHARRRRRRCASSTSRAIPMGRPPASTALASAKPTAQTSAATAENVLRQGRCGPLRVSLPPRSDEHVAFLEIRPRPLRAWLLTKTTGRESIYLRLPRGQAAQPNAKKKADTWTSAFYTGELKHA